MANSRKSKSNDLNGRVADALIPVVPPGSAILLGLSGGMDSVVLLHLLAQLPRLHSWQLSALHVHHGISPRADEWAAFCRELCAQHSIPLQVERVDITPLREKGIEAAARELRHAALSRQSTDFIALAHHQDDQAETLLLQLLRGAGVKGAAGMQSTQRITARTPSPPEGEGWGEGEALRCPQLLRPLLDIPRATLLAYAQQHGLQWVEDESNADDSYPRNFLRHRVLPLLEQRFPACRATLARSAHHFAEAAELLDVLAEQDAQGAINGETLLVARLVELDVVRAKNLLRWFLQQRGALMPEHQRLDEMLRQLRAAREDAQIYIVWGNWELRRYRGSAYVRHVQVEPQADFCVAWSGEENVMLPGGVLHFESCLGAGISANKLQDQLITIRLRQGHETLRPDAARPARTLHYLFQEHGIPPWQRAGWPLLYCGATLAAVPSMVVASDYQAAAGEAGFLLRWAQ